MTSKRHVLNKEDLDSLVSDTDSELSGLNLSSSSLEDLLDDLLLLQDDAIEPAQSCSDWKELGTICNKCPFTGDIGVRLVKKLQQVMFLKFLNLL